MLGVTHNVKIKSQDEKYTKINTDVQKKWKNSRGMHGISLSVGKTVHDSKADKK